MIFTRMMLTLTLILGLCGAARADLDGYLEHLRISADADFGAFRAGLGAHFDASGAELDHVFLAVGHPGEAALCFWLARESGRPVSEVVERYRVHRKQGWGALAQSLGIKPGSPAFKALKAGQIGWEPPGGHGAQKGTGGDRSKGADHKVKGDKGKGKK